MIEFSRNVCANLDEALGREWLETNGLGGYASATVAGLNTRRYHGLLVAAIRPPVGRSVLLAKLEEAVIVDGERFELSANQYPGVIHPQGHLFLERFRLDPFPVFTYAVKGVEIEKTIFMKHGSNATVIQYAVRKERHAAPHSLHLEIRPLVAFRDYHSLGRERDASLARLRAEGAHLTVDSFDGSLPPIHFAHNADRVETAGWWYRQMEYREERTRGFDFTEDLYSPCALHFDLSSRTSAALIAATERHDINRAPEYRRAEIARRAEAEQRVPVSDGFVRTLARAADQYLVARGARQTVIAGYHWFGDWGRDTMIALPGLALVTGRFEVAKSVLLEFARHVDRGMLPNRFPDAGETPEYNTVDATLWFFEAVRALLRYTDDLSFIRDHLYATLAEIIAWHERGTRYNIRVEADGLLAAGAEGVQLTWMDARVGDRVITPRHGKAVEVQALWYNALRVMEELARRLDDPAAERRYSEMAAKARYSFNRLFWNEEAGCLYDVVVDEENRDASLRPNQIIALSLPDTMLSLEKARRVLSTVERELLTPYGLRSLAPGDPQYRGRYEGDGAARDGVYHQGTVWAWLMGPFITAYVRTHERSRASRQRAALWLRPFAEHLQQAGLGHVSEIFDGDAPHTPRGAVAQAWSVAELLRAAVEDVFAETEAAAARPQTTFSLPALRSFPAPARSLWGRNRIL